MFERILLSATLLACMPVASAAQDWRDVTSFRQRSDEERLDVHLRYGAGQLVVEPGSAGELYRAAIRYDADGFEPVTNYQAGELEVGVEGGGQGINLRSNKSGTMTLRLSPDVPLDLDLDFGAVEANMELGGLHLSRMDVETGASDTRILFSTPNQMACESLAIHMGAAALEARGLANANCRRVTAEGGVGDLTLEFSGAWKQDLDADITIALGSVTLRVPENVGVRVIKETFLAGFNGRRFHEREGTHYSDNWDQTERKLTVEVEGAFGSINVRWIAPAAVTP